MTSARNLKVINPRAKKEKCPDYVPSALEVQRDTLITDIRSARKSIRKEDALIRKMVLVCMVREFRKMRLLSQITKRQRQPLRH